MYALVPKAAHVGVRIRMREKGLYQSEVGCISQKGEAKTQRLGKQILRVIRRMYGCEEEKETKRKRKSFLLSMHATKGSLLLPPKSNWSLESGGISSQPAACGC